MIVMVGLIFNYAVTGESSEEYLSVEYDIAERHEFEESTAPRTMSVSTPLPSAAASSEEARSRTLALVLASAVMVAALGAAMAYIYWRNHLDGFSPDTVKADAAMANLVVIAFFGMTALSLGMILCGESASAAPIVPEAGDDVVAEVGPADYVIITADAFSDEVLPLAEWKDEKGYRTALVKMSLVGTEDTEIKEFLQEVYDADGDTPSYLLLVGDHESVPSHHVQASFWYSDYEYALLDGDDEFADLAVGRLPADTEDEVTIMVDRILGYEQTPNTGDWYDDVLFAGHFQDIDYDNTADHMFMEDIHRASDFLGGDLDFWVGEDDPYNEGFTIHTNRTWDAEPGETLSYGGWEYPGRIDPPNSLPDAWMDHADEEITVALENGVTLVMHRNHGSSSGWTHPRFRTDDVEALENGDMVPFVFSLNCSSGNFDEGDAFAEAWLHNPDGGAVAFIGAQTTSYSGYNDALHVGLLDAMWDAYDADWTSSQYDNSWHIGDVLNYAKDRVLDGYGDDDDGTALVTAQMFNLLGDPEMMLRTASPSTLAVSHPSSVDVGDATDVKVTVSIDGEPVSGALVAITSGTPAADERWVGVTDGTGTVAFEDLRTTSAGAYQITVTERNSTPYEGTIKSLVAGTDLVGTGLTVKPLDLYGEDAMTVNFTIMNVGTADAVPSDAVFFLSDDQDFDLSEDVKLLLHPDDPAYDPSAPASFHVDGLDAGEDLDGEVILRVPGTDPFGTDNEYHLIMKVDAQNSVFETSESNNATVGTRVVTMARMYPEMGVSGNGIVIENGSDHPTTLDGTDFGPVNVERGAVSHTFTLTNAGTDTLVLTNELRRVFLLGPNVLDFYLVEDAGSPLAGDGGSTTFMILFDPMYEGIRTATVNIESNDPNADPFVFTIRGRGAVPEVELNGNGVPIDDGDTTPSPIDDTDFGSSVVGSGPVTRTFTIVNIGTSALTLYEEPRVRITGPGADHFTVTTQPDEMVGSDSGRTTFTIAFEPSELGLHTATVSFSTNDADEGLFTFDVQGTGMREFDISENGDPLDYGDAPDSYLTLLASGGASHVIIPELFIGATAPDAETDGAPTSGANGDDVLGGPPDDEDIMGSFPWLAKQDTTYSVTIPVTNTTGGDAFLWGWIDFNRNGTFQSGEGTGNTVNDGQTQSILTWSGFSASPGDTYLRIRLTTDVSITLSTPGGTASDGEVEDYPTTIHNHITNNTGGGQSHNNVQPSLGIYYVICLSGYFPSRNGAPTEDSEPFIGEIMMFGGNFPPRNWAFCDGQLLPIAQNTALFSLLGTTYGGDGRTTFALPDLRGRVPVGVGSGPGLTPVSWGQRSGTETNTVTVNQLASHSHNLPAPANGPTPNTGGSQSINNMQPYLGLYYVIALQGIYPSRNAERNEGSEPFIGEIRLVGFNFPPRGWAYCEGQLLSIASYSALFSLLGTTYGGDGRTTFALPDLRGRIAVHPGTGPGLSNYRWGERGGTNSTTLNTNTIPAHNHYVPQLGGDTANTGGNQSHSNIQPYLALYHSIALQGIYPSRNGGASVESEPYLAEIVIFGFNFAPRGWGFCDGQLLSISSYSAVFSLLGTTFGGDGRTTFALPDLRSRVAMHPGNGPGLSNRRWGEKMGAETTTLTINQIPSHNHVGFLWETIAEIDGNDDLMIYDSNGGNSDDSLILSIVGTNVRVHDPNLTVYAGNGATQFDAHTVDVPTASITGTSGIIVNTYNGSDTINVEGLNLTFGLRIESYAAIPYDDTVNFRSASTSTGGGDVTVTTDRIVVSADLDSGGGDVTLTAREDVEVNASVQTGNGILTVDADSDGDDSGTFRLGTVVPTTYPEQAILRASDAQTSDEFGYTVAIDGDTAIVGAQYENGGTGNPISWSGAAYVFERIGSTWIEQAILRASDAQPGDRFGYSVAISGDTAIVGAPYEWGGAGDSASESGAVYVFVRSGTTWTEQQILRASNAQANDYFGWSVSVSGDSTIVGAYKEDGATDTLSGSGAAYVFTRSAGTWTEQQILRASNAQSDDEFGHSVAIDGDTAIVGAPKEDGATDTLAQSGAAYVFVRSGTTWTEQQILRASDAQADDLFGWSVAISGDTAIVGAYHEDGGATDPKSDSGAAYVFTRSGTTWTEQQILRASDAQDNDAFGYSVAIDGDTAIVGAPSEDGGVGNPLSDSGAAYVFTRSGSTWTEQAILRASDAQGSDNFGWSVSISSDTALIGAYKEDGGAFDTLPDSGAAYIFQREAGGPFSGSLSSGTGNMSITAADVELIDGTVSGSDPGTLTMRPSTTSRSIGIGGGTGDFNLDDSELGMLVDGFSGITIGDATGGTGTVDIDTATFLDDVTITGGDIHDAATGDDVTAPSVTMIGNVSPGQSPGILEVTGSFSFADNSTFEVEIGGTSPGTLYTNHDQLSASGSVTIGSNVTLDEKFWSSFSPALGDEFIIIQRTGGSGTFTGMPEGDVFSNFLGSGNDAIISYVGGDGDDVVISVVSPGDYGDAPTSAQSGFAANYPTTYSDNGARHADVGPVLGSLRDFESTGIPHVDALGDDLDNNDDEDGIIFDTILMVSPRTSQSAPVKVDLLYADATANYLNAWIDFNQDGDWADAGEQVLTDHDLGTTDGQQTVNLTMPQDTGTNVVTGETYIRFRLDTTGGLSFDGPADDGEVEDYKITIWNGTYGDLDYGDAPDSYATLDASGGPKHGIYPTIYLGTNNAPDYDTDGFQDGTEDNPNTATDDDTEGTEPDDEDGVVYLPVITTFNTSYSVLVDVTNVTGTTVSLLGWIDFDGDDIFQADEGTQTPVVHGEIQQTLTWNSIGGVGPDIASGETFARFRITSDPSITTSKPGSAAIDGEVEDYFLEILPDPIDWGDAPTPYPVTALENGASHRRVDSSGPILGNIADAEDAPTHSANADADDMRAPFDDEDGVTIVGALVASAGSAHTATINVNLSNADPTSNILDAWLDLNGDGDWDDADEQIFTNFDLGTTNGIQSLNFTIPQEAGGNVVAGETFARFRVSTQGNLSYTGYSDNGEVEDHTMFINIIETEISVDGSGVVTIEDVSSGGVNSNLHIVMETPYLHIDDSSNPIFAGPGAIQVGPNVVHIPLSSITELIVNVGVGDDSLNINFGGGNYPFPITYNGGEPSTGPGDSLSMMGGTFDTMTFTPTGPGGGTIGLPGNELITFTGLEPVDATGMTYANLTIVLPGSDDNTELLDLGGGNSRFMSTDTIPTFEMIDFAHPTDTLTIRGGEGNDSIEVSSLASSYPANLIIDGQGGTDVVDITGTISFDTGKDLTVTTDTFWSRQTVSVPGTVTIVASGDVHVTGLWGLTMVRITSTGGGIIDYANSAADIVSSLCALRAVTGIGSADTLETRISTLAASNTTSGSILIDNSGAGLLTIGTVDGLVGVTNSASGGGITIVNGSPLTVKDDITASGSITITASDSAAVGDDLIISSSDTAGTGSVAITSTGGDVTLRAGDNLTVQTTAIVSAVGKITFQSDYLNADPGVGSILTLGIGIYNTGTTGEILGGTDDDEFWIDPLWNLGEFRIDGVAGDDLSYIWMDNLIGKITFDDLSGEGNDKATLYGSGGADTIFIDPGQVTMGARIISYTSHLETLVLNSSGGQDLILVKPSTTLKIEIFGGAPTTTPGDTVIYSTPSGQAATLVTGGPDDGTITCTGGYKDVDFDEIELIAIGGEIIVYGSGDDDLLVITATGPYAGTFQLTTDVDGSAGGPIVGPIISFTFATKFSFHGGGGSDELRLIHPSGSLFIPVLGIIYNGGLGTSLDSDTLTIVGGMATDVTYEFTNINDGTIDWDGTVLTYTGLEPISSTISTTNVTLNYSGVDETIDISDGSGGSTTVTSTAAETVTFSNPSGTLTVNAGAGDDVVTLKGSPTSSTIVLNGQAGEDTINVWSTGSVSDTTINGGDNTDTINLGSTTNSLGGIIGNITVNGDAHDSTSTTDFTIGVDTNTLDTGDVLIFNDHGDNGSYGYSLTTFSFSRDAVGAIYFYTIETMNINTSMDAANFNCVSTGPGVNTYIDFQDAADVIDVSRTGEDSNVSLLMGGGEDTVTVGTTGDDGADGNAFGGFLIIYGEEDADTITLEGTAADGRVGISGMGGSDTIDIWTTGASSYSDISGGANTDTFNIGSPSNSLSGILGDIVIDGDDHDAGTTTMTILGARH